MNTERKNRKERLRNSETKKITFMGGKGRLTRKYDISPVSWKLKSDKNVLRLSPFCNHQADLLE